MSERYEIPQIVVCSIKPLDSDTYHDGRKKRGFVVDGGAVMTFCTSSPLDFGVKLDQYIFLNR